MTLPRPNLTPAGFFCLRAHLLPFGQLVDWGAGLTLPLATPATYQEALTGDLAHLRSRLLAWTSDPQIREALFLASPSLEESLPLWQRDPRSDRGQRVERALVKYLVRMATRPTPFGLFAGVAIGTLATTTDLTVPPRGQVARQTRLDNEYLFRLIAALQRDPAVRSRMQFRPNDTLHVTLGGFRYIEGRAGKESHTFHLVEIDATPLLRNMLAAAEDGADRATLVALVTNSAVEEEAAARYVDEVIDSQLLIPDLGVEVTGRSPADVLVERLADVPEVKDLVVQLERAIAAMGRLDSAVGPSAPQGYRDIADGLSTLPVPVELPRLFQVDLARNSAGTLGTSVVHELHRAVELLHRLTPAPRDSQLASFTTAFMERYQGRTVPLLEALDAESGLGALLGGTADPSPLLRGLALGREEPTRIAWGAREAHLLHRSSQVAASGALEWELTPADLDALGEATPRPLPDAGAVIATLSAASETAVARGEFELFVPYVDGPSGAKLLGRFCHLAPQLHAAVVQHLRAEEAMEPETLFAEIVHLPDGRIGNVICRPHLRDYHITFAGHSGLPRDRQIPATDLQLSVRDGQLELHSRRLARRIVPRLTTAHNFSYGLAAYRFLCLLQSHGRSGPLGWSWGALDGAAFLPRVRHGRLVLALARWRLGKAEISSLQAGSAGDRFTAVQRLRAQRRLPRWIALVEGDNRLPVDLDNVLMVDCLLHEIADHETAVLEELWPAADHLIARGPEGAYRHELVLPFTVARPAEPAISVRAPASAGADRRFAPGSEWLYLKLYCGTAEADRILEQVISPMSRQWIQRSTVDRWHFLRYADPETHLRWRVHGNPAVLAETVWPAMQQAVGELLTSGRAWRIQLDSYDREVERYGGPAAIGHAETIFFHDSNAVVDLLELFDAGDTGLEERWRMGLRGADQLLEDFGLSVAERLEALPRMAGYGSVANPSSAQRQQLSGKFREIRSSVEGLLDRTKDGASALGPGLEVLADRSQRLAPSIAALRTLAGQGQLAQAIDSIAGSCIHMYLNRLLRESPNAHETVIYDWLRRTYESRLAREKGRSTSG